MSQITANDDGTPATQASVVFYAANGTELHRLSTKDTEALKPAEFKKIMATVVAKNQRLLRDVVDGYLARKKAEAKAAKAVAKAD